MEEQQKRHIKEVYMDSALKSLASDPGNVSISNFPFKSAHTQNTQTERTNEMITQPVKEMVKLSTMICREGMMIWSPQLIQMMFHHQMDRLI